MNPTINQAYTPGLRIPNQFQYPAYPVPTAQFQPLMTNTAPVTQPNIAEKALPNIIEINLPYPYQLPLNANTGM